MLLINSDIDQIIDCKSVISFSERREISSLAYDARRIFEGESSLFFALSGKNNDGHHYIKQAYDRGVREFVISDKSFIKKSFEEANFYVCNNSLEALQSIAYHIRSQRQCHVLAITGSNGKTICKEWLHELIGESSFRSPLSYNSQIGVPISLSMIPINCSIAIIEAGISEQGEMEKHSKMIRPENLIITNIGEAHNAGFEGRNNKLAEKGILAEHANRIFIHSETAGLYEYLRSQFPDKEIISWGNKINDHISIRHRVDNKYVLTRKNKEYEFEFNLSDRISLENLGHILNYLVYDEEQPEIYLNKCHLLRPIEMRLQLVEGINNCKIVNDAYNSDLYSLTRALSYLEQQDEDKKKTLVISSLEGSGLNQAQIQESLKKIISESKVERVLLYGVQMHGLKSELPNHIDVQLIVDIQQLKGQYFENEVILVKGARKYQLEQFVEHIESKALTTALEINLSAIEHNYDYLKSKLNPDTKVMAVIKASGYGSGGYVIAKTLENKRVDYLAVAHIDEGIYLRKQNINTPIVVLNPDRNNLRKLFEHNLQFEIYNLELLNDIIQISRQLQSPCGIHINLDTGMNRLGFKSDELDALIGALSNANFVKVISVFSHLSSSEDAEHDILSEQQFHSFIDSADKIDRALEIKSIKHILNTSGILRHNKMQLDMVRTGLGLYGLELSNREAINLQKVHRLTSYVLQIKPLNKGESIGYNAAFKADKNMTVATLNIGYADGLKRSLSSGKWKVSIHGKPATILGKISMDLTTVDISNIPNVKVGDQVIIFDELNTIESMSDKADTIPYEILTGISERVKRIYYKE